MEDREVNLDDIRECDETVEVNKKAIECLIEVNALDNLGYAPERYAKRELRNSVE